MLAIQYQLQLSGRVGGALWAGAVLTPVTHPPSRRNAEKMLQSVTKCYKSTSIMRSFECQNITSRYVTLWLCLDEQKHSKLLTVLTVWIFKTNCTGTSYHTDWHFGSKKLRCTAILNCRRIKEIKKPFPTKFRGFRPIYISGNKSVSTTFRRIRFSSTISGNFPPNIRKRHRRAAKELEALLANSTFPVVLSYTHKLKYIYPKLAISYPPSKK